MNELVKQRTNERTREYKPTSDPTHLVWQPQEFVCTQSQQLQRGPIRVERRRAGVHADASAQVSQFVAGQPPQEDSPAVLQHERLRHGGPCRIGQRDTSSHITTAMRRSGVHHPSVRREHEARSKLRACELVVVCSEAGAGEQREPVRAVEGVRQVLEHPRIPDRFWLVGWQHSTGTVRMQYNTIMHARTRARTRARTHARTHERRHARTHASR